MVALRTLSREAHPAATDDSIPRADLRTSLEGVSPAVFRVLRRMGVTGEEQDDAAQSVLIQLARRWDNLGRLPESELRAYACAVAVGVARDVGRERGRRKERTAPFDDNADEPLDEPGPDDVFERKRKLEVLDRILLTMPEDRRVVFILYEIEELELRQIADRLALPMGTVSSRLRKAREEFDRAAARERAIEERTERR